jgi:drug/metabolite transporter (DMT)-like permease
LLWSAALGFLVFGDVPSGRLWVGAAVIIAAGLYVMLRAQLANEPVPLPGQSA